MNKLYVRSCALLLALLFFCPGKAQDHYSDDAQLWFDIYVEKKITKKFDIFFKQQNRIVNNVSQYGQGYGNIGLGFKITKNVKLTGGYKFMEKKGKSDNFKTKHRYYVGVILKADLSSRWKLTYRNLVQCTFKAPNTSKTGYIPYLYDRNKLTLKFEATKRLEFYVASEINIPLNDPAYLGISRLRSTAGIYIKTTRHQQLELYYLYQAKLQNSDWYKQDVSYPNAPLGRKFVIGIGYQFMF